MNHWYLVASLPSLVLGAEPPLSPAAFRVLCGEHLPESDRRELDAVFAEDAVAEDAVAEGAVAGDAAEVGPATSAFAQSWRQFRSRLQTECAVHRAARLGVDAGPWQTDTGVPDAALAAAVREAMQQPDPRTRELHLDTLRWRTLEDLAREAPFGLPAVLAYGLRLRTAARWANRTEAAGRQRLAGHLEAMFAVFDRKARENQP